MFILKDNVKFVDGIFVIVEVVKFFFEWLLKIGQGLVEVFFKDLKIDVFDEYMVKFIFSQLFVLFFYMLVNDGVFIINLVVLKEYVVDDVCGFFV